MGVASVIGAALAAAGTGVSIANARATSERMNEVVRQQLAKQDVFQRQATPIFEKSLGESSPSAARGQLAQGSEDASSIYRQLAQLPASTASSPIQEDKLINARTQAQIGQQQGAQATFFFYGNFNLQQWLKDQEARRNLGVISGLSSSQAATTPYLLQGAQNQGQNLAAVGSLLGTAGSLAGVYGTLYPYLQNKGG